MIVISTAATILSIVGLLFVTAVACQRLLSSQRDAATFVLIVSLAGLAAHVCHLASRDDVGQAIRLVGAGAFIGVVLELFNPRPRHIAEAPQDPPR